MEIHLTAMLLHNYKVDDLKFAYCYRVYMRWRTHRVTPCPPMAIFTIDTLKEIAATYDIHALECATSDTDLLSEISLRPIESISGAASKLKGQVSSWLRAQLRLERAEKLLSSGYFACTVGKSTRADVEEYLSSQADHHGYAQRILPPVYVKRFEPEISDVTVKHSSVLSQFHIVLATFLRKGVFRSADGERLTSLWQTLQDRWRLVKVSFVPDHVHLAVRLHAAVAPADVVIRLMNSAQEAMEDSLVSVGINRLWQPSAYVGSYGDLASPQIRKYIENWKANLERGA